MSQSQSPSKKEVSVNNEFDFSEAIKHIVDGEKVTRKEWNNKEFYGFLNGEWLSVHKPDGKNYQWIVSEGDLKGTDWFVI